MRSSIKIEPSYKESPTVVKMLGRYLSVALLYFTSSIAFCQAPPHMTLEIGGHTQGVNAFSEIGGSWMWVTVKKWNTTLWYAPSPNKKAAILEVVTNVDARGTELSYLPSPSGRKVLYRSSSNISVNWTIFDRITGERRHLKLPQVVAQRLDGATAIWNNESQIFLLDLQPVKTKTSRSWQQIWCLDVKSGRLKQSRRNILVNNDVLDGYIQYCLRYDKSIRPELKLLGKFHELPDDMSSSGHLDELSTVGDIMNNRSWNNKRGGTLAILPGNTRIGSLKSSSTGQNPKIILYGLGASKPSSTLELKPLNNLDYVDKLRVASPTDLIFERAEYRPEGGVGANEVKGSGWDWVIHPSRYRTEILRWNLKTNTLSFVTFGHNALRLPPV